MAALRASRLSVTCVAALLPLAMTVGCNDPSPRLFEVRARVTSDGSSPVAGARIRVRGDALGTSDVSGGATLRVEGQEGDRVPVALACPEGFRSPPRSGALELTGASEHGTLVMLELTCELELREAVVLVHTAGDASRLPVKVDGVVVGQTDALGFAHIHVRAVPNSEFEVSLDTSANERLSPANPAQRYRLQRSDELFVLDTTFQDPQAAARKRRLGKRRVAATPASGN